jgi:flagellar operon protein
MSSPIPNPALIPLGGIGAASAPSQRTQREQSVTGPSFDKVLSGYTSAAEPPRFSRHALERLQRRGIDVQGPTLARLTDGVSRAAAKGSRDSVVFVDGTAFVVSVKNNTVITAVGSEHMREQVFTNIDSAVIA